jgi:hypothetical protein
LRYYEPVERSRASSIAPYAERQPSRRMKPKHRAGSPTTLGNSALLAEDRARLRRREL